MQLLTTKQRIRRVLARAAMVIAISAASSLVAQLGAWVYDQGFHSRELRILGGGLTGTGVVANILTFIWTLLSVWSWPGRYELALVEAEDKKVETLPLPRRYGNVHPAHSVKLRRVKS